MSNKHKHCVAEGINKTGLTVKVHDNNVDRAAKQLKKLILGEGLLKELNDKRFYEKPSVRKRREKAEAVNRARRETRLRNME